MYLTNSNNIGFDNSEAFSCNTTTYHSGHPSHPQHQSPGYNFNTSPYSHNSGIYHNSPSPKQFIRMTIAQHSPGHQSVSSQSCTSSHIPADLFRQGVLEHALSLGMDPTMDAAFLWIAEKSLQEPLPQNWIQASIEEGENGSEGEIYFYNQVTGESSWEHPKDQYYRRLYQEKKNARNMAGQQCRKVHQNASNLNNIISEAEEAVFSLKEEMRRLSISDSPKLAGKKQTSPMLTSYEEKQKQDGDLESLATVPSEQQQQDLIHKHTHSIQKQLDDALGRLSMKEKEIQELQHKYDTEIKNIEDQQDKIIKESNEASLRVVKDLETKLTVQENLNVQLKESHQLELLTLRNSIMKLEAKYSEAENETHEKHNTILNLQNELNELRQQETSFNENTESEERYKKTIHELENRVEELEKELHLRRSELEDLRAIIKENELLLKESKDENNNLKEKYDKIKIEMERQTKDLQTLQCSERQAYVNVEKSKTRSSFLEVEIDSLKRKYEEVKDKAKQLNSKVLDLQGNIRVFCRVRPLATKEQLEIGSTQQLDVQYLDESSMLFYGNHYEFDHIFAPNAIQGSIFSEISPAVSSALDGHSVCIFAYGQTGSGKTYTMEGPSHDRGVNYRTLEEIFEQGSRIQNVSREAKNHIKYAFSVSILEVYNETLHDLLDSNNLDSEESETMKTLSIRVKDEEVYVEGLIEHRVECIDDVEKLMKLASSCRSTASNNVNEHSSRSHLVLSVKILGQIGDGKNRIRGKLNLIDLAGSERLKQTSASGQRLKEAQNINRSLSALGDVINALGDPKCKHVPYRNSKLTFLLQDSLKVNAKVLMFCNINPSPKNSNESICSLKFASRCRAVVLGKARKDSTINTSSSKGRLHTPRRLDDIDQLNTSSSSLSVAIESRSTRRVSSASSITSGFSTPVKRSDSSSSVKAPQTTPGTRRKTSSIRKRLPNGQQQVNTSSSISGRPTSR